MQLISLNGLIFQCICFLSSLFLKNYPAFIRVISNKNDIIFVVIKSSDYVVFGRITWWPWTSNKKTITCITTHQISSVSQIRIVKLVAIWLHKVLITYTHCQPIAWILIYSECYRTPFLSILLQWRLQKPQVIIVRLWWLYYLIWNNINTNMLELIAKLETNLTIENWRILGYFL